MLGFGVLPCWCWCCVVLVLMSCCCCWWCRVVRVCRAGLPRPAAPDAQLLWPAAAVQRRHDVHRPRAVLCQPQRRRDAQRRPRVPAASGRHSHRPQGCVQTAGALANVIGETVRLCNWDTFTAVVPWLWPCVLCLVGSQDCTLCLAILSFLAPAFLLLLLLPPPPSSTPVCQNIEVNALGVQPQHCVVLNTLDTVVREMSSGLDESGGSATVVSASRPAGASRRLVVVIRPGRTAEVYVNGVRIVEDTKLVHGDRCVPAGSWLCVCEACGCRWSLVEYDRRC